MTSCKGCVGEFFLALGMLAVAVFFVWAKVNLPLEELGTVEHMAFDGTTKTSPCAVFVMIGLVGLGIIVAASKLHQAEKRVIEAGDSAGAADPIAPVTQVARSGYGTAFAWLAVLAVCGVLAVIASLVMGGS